MTGPGQAVAVPGLVDAHAHLLRVSVGVPFPGQGTSAAEFHHQVAGLGSTPMDMADPEPPGALAALPGQLLDGLRAAAAAGLVEVTEMGIGQWFYLDMLSSLQHAGPLPVRVRVYLASGLAEQASMADLEARRSDAGPWVSVDGVKFYADGWLGPRTCAMCDPFADSADRGVLFMDAATLARRIEPFAARGWRVATHAIGDRAIGAVLDAYDMAWAGDRGAIARAAPRIEHASIVPAELMSRLAESGAVACIQPSFAVTDAGDLLPGLGPSRVSHAYPWRALASSGMKLLAGSDYPFEVLEPLAGLARLVNGRSLRPGFGTVTIAPDVSRLDVATAFSLLSDPAAGRTLLSADPRTVPAAGIDQIEVHGTAVNPFF
jgi:predicted amidohydrolase YtcJ